MKLSAVFGIFAACLMPAAPAAYAQREAPPATASIALRELPPEVRRTVVLIRQGGPFPYPRDGVAFGNREGRLPPARRAYYHEYTVPTPGAHNRGARRIVAGQGGELYYSDDHYETFRRIRE
jgi:ribonuclease T1